MEQNNPEATNIPPSSSPPAETATTQDSSPKPEDISLPTRLSTSGMTDIFQPNESLVTKDLEPQNEGTNELSPLYKDPNKLPLGLFLSKSAQITFSGMFLYISLLLLQTINLAFIGQKYEDDKMIDAIGITNLYMNCALNSIYTGLISGMETLAANAYGTKRYKLLGYYYHRARIIGYAVTIVLVVIHLFTVSHVLRFFKLDEKVIEYSIIYIYSSLVYIFFDVQTSCVFNMLSVLEKSHISFIILLISLFLHPVWNYIFITVLDYGVAGAGISFTISKFLSFVMATVYYWNWNPVPESNFWINKKCFGIRGIINYLKFSFGSAFLTCAEWWGIEIQAIIAIYIGNDDYTVYILISDLTSLLYSIDEGFMLSITILVGEIIANGTIKQVKLSCIYSFVFGLVSNFVFCGTFFIFRKSIFNIFTNEEKLLELAYPVLIVISISEYVDLIQTMLVSIFRGIGRQYTASILMFIHYYVIMIGLSIFFGIYWKWGVFGMFVGIGASDLLMSIVYFITLVFIDFSKAQKETIERLKKDNSLTFIVGDEEENLVSEEEEKKE